MDETYKTFFTKGESDKSSDLILLKRNKKRYIIKLNDSCSGLANGYALLKSNE